MQLAKAWQARLVVLTAIEPDVQEALRREPYEAPSWRRMLTVRRPRSSGADQNTPVQ